MLVILVLFSVLLDNSGLVKAGPRQAEFEPAPGKTYKFSDVHGVDEAKEVRGPHTIDHVKFTALFPRNCKKLLNF